MTQKSEEVAAVSTEALSILKNLKLNSDEEADDLNLTDYEDSDLESSDEENTGMEVDPSILQNSKEFKVLELDPFIITETNWATDRVDAPYKKRETFFYGTQLSIKNAMDFINGIIEKTDNGEEKGRGAKALEGLLKKAVAFNTERRHNIINFLGIDGENMSKSAKDALREGAYNDSGKFLFGPTFDDILQSVTRKRNMKSNTVPKRDFQDGSGSGHDKRRGRGRGRGGPPEAKRQKF